MTRGAILLTAMAGVGAALALTAAQQPPQPAKPQPGIWEITGAPGVKAPIRQCVTDVQALARFEHRSKSCNARVIKSAGTSSVIEYSCAGGGFGRTQVDVLTPRSLRISTQGIADGLPFNYVLQARRVDDCAAKPEAVAVRH